MNYKLAIFDLDGTLADTLDSMATAGNETLIAFGLQKRKVEEYKYFVGDGADVLVKRILLAEGDSELIHYEEGYALYRKLLDQYSTHKIKLYDGILEMLDTLKKKNIKVAILTNKPQDAAMSVINQLFEADYIDKVIGQQDGIKKKPDKEGAIMLADYFKVKPEECVYVGDTNVDMMTGNAAGMYTVGVTWGFRTEEELREHHAHKIIHHPMELCEIF